MMRAHDNDIGDIMTTISHYSIHAAREGARRALLRSVLAAAGMLAGINAVGAQQAPAGRLWAAQTGIDQVTLAWDSVPGTAEYRVYLGDPSAPGTLTRPPARRLRGHSRRTILTGVQRAANGITLVAVDAGGGVLRQAAFNRVTPATFFPPATPPTGVTAQATSGSEVVVTWDSVPGATGYVIGRSVHKSGFSMLCSLCPNEVQYVDRNVMAGLPHTYNVAAIFPSGDVSRRVVSTPVTPGATQVAPVVTPPVMPPSGAPIGGMPPGGVPTVGAPPGVPTGALPTSTSGYPPPGQPAGTMPTSTTSTSTTTAGTSTHAATSPTTSTGTSSGPIPSTTLQAAAGNMMSRIDSLLSGMGSMAGGLGGRLAGAVSGGVAAPPSITVAATGPGAVVVSWQPSPTTGVTGYTVNRSLNGGALEELAKVAATQQSYNDGFFPATLFASGTVRAKYGVVATASAGFRGIVSSEVVVQPSASTPAPGGGSLASCRLDFQRADNMWAGFGAPTGSLGTESISLSPGQNKVFITDWKYEKQPNDGTNFYGSHLRIGANPTSSTIRLHLRSWTLTGLQVFARTGNDTFWIRLDPNTNRQFQADLMEVFCES
jgi:hypothetical protein